VLAIGLVVDDAIVVVENVSRLVEERGLSPRDATPLAMREVTAPIVAISLVLMAVFLPVAFLPGTTGRLYQQFALTIAFAVSMSLLVAFTLDPMLSSRFVKYVPPEERTKTRVGRMLEAWGRFYDRIDARYQRVLVVDCSEAQQIERVMRRSALSEKEVRDILASQATREERLAMADDVIDNRGDPEALERQVSSLNERYLTLARDSKRAS